MARDPDAHPDGSPGPGGTLGTGGLIARMIGFVVVGAPLVYVLWSWVNELLSGTPTAEGTLRALPALVLFLVLLHLLTRAVRRWEGSVSH